ncbi:MAG TPA: hypothetical protein H9730_01130 [Candidatus Mediterraneibacter stercoripullorum]|nr:hypothetical protein [Candidatus Mediterraneibacter stercoripullorum]
MNMKKKIAASLIVIMALAAAVCAGVWFYINRFDPQAYVQAVLDVSYKDETEAYMEIARVTEEEADAVFENNLDATMEEFESSPMPEELKPQYRELFGEIAKSVNYTVGEAVREEDGSFSVPLKIKPITLFADTYDQFRDKAQEYADQVTDRVMQGDEMPSDEEMQAEVYRIYYTVLKTAMDEGPLYGEAQDITLRVAKNDAGEYKIDTEDMQELDTRLIEDGEEKE